MGRAIITPWRTHKDLLDVRKQLYRLDSSSGDEDRRHHAVQRVMAWKARGNLPHAVESTALLMDAILHHNIEPNSIFSIRAVYSAAFTRFVTGFCDIGRSKERSLEPSSMLEIAKQIDMPVEFVTLRHEATHQELPELHRLVDATEDALDWLWTVYWSRLDEPTPTDPASTAMTQFRADARQKLRDFRSARREALRARQQGASERDSDVWKAAKSCVDLMGGDEVKTEAFVDVLLSDKLLIPSKRTLGASLHGAFLIWDQLLQEIFAEQHQFLPCFVDRVLTSIATSPATTTQPEYDADTEALCMWMLHLLEPSKGSGGWGPALTASERQLLQTHTIMFCCTHPGHWTHHLGAALLHSAGAEFQATWGEILASSRMGGDSSHENLESSAPAEVSQGPPPRAARRARTEDPCATGDRQRRRALQEDVDDESDDQMDLVEEEDMPGMHDKSWTRQVVCSAGPIGRLS